MQILVIWHFNLEYYIWIEINILDYIIEVILTQLTKGFIILYKPK